MYKHPNYQYPKLYDDIAVLELGRRIDYNFEKVSLRSKLLEKQIT